MNTHRIKKIFGAPLVAITMAAMPMIGVAPAMADQGGHTSDRPGGNRLGEGSHANFRLPNGGHVPLECHPYSDDRPCVGP